MRWSSLREPSGTRSFASRAPERFGRGRARGVCEVVSFFLRFFIIEFCAVIKEFNFDRTVDAFVNTVLPWYKAPRRTTYVGILSNDWQCINGVSYWVAYSLWLRTGPEHYQTTYHTWQLYRLIQFLCKTLRTHLCLILRTCTSSYADADALYKIVRFMA